MTTYEENGDSAISEWEVALKMHTVENAYTYLSSLDLREMPLLDSTALLSQLLLSMYDAQAENPTGLGNDDTLLDRVLSTFEVIRPPFARQVPMTSILITLPLIDLGAVSWVWMRREIDIVTVFLDLVDWLPNDQVGLVLPRVVTIFLRNDPEQIYDVYANPSIEGSLATLLHAGQIGFLMDEAEKKGNDTAWNWLREEFAKNGPLVKAGPWVLQGETPKVILPLPRAYIVGEPLRP